MFKAWLERNIENVIFTVALASVTVGFGLAWLPLGFIVPGLLVCGLMVWSQARAVEVVSPPNEEPGDNDA